MIPYTWADSHFSSLVDIKTVPFSKQKLEGEKRVYMQRRQIGKFILD